MIFGSLPPPSRLTLLFTLPHKKVGNGFHVYPVFADMAFTEELSPFLMFDYAAPKEFPPNAGKPKGVGQVRMIKEEQYEE